MRSHAKATVAVLAMLLTLAVGVSLSAADTAPSVAIDPASDVSYTSAKLSGTVNPNGGPSTTFWQLQYSTESEGPWELGASGQFEGTEAEETTPLPVSAELSGLKPNTSYFFRLIAVNEDGANQSIKAGPSFTTLETPAPTVSIDPVTTFDSTTAQFSGDINPNGPEAAPTTPEVEAGLRVQWSFQCTPACPGLEGEIEADESSHEVNAEASGLKPGTEYDVTLVAKNAGAEANAGPESFTTDALAPVIANALVSGIGETGATFKATINPNGAATSYRFEYVDQAEFEANGFDNATKVPVPDGAIGAGNADVSVNQAVSGLKPGTDYRFHVVATNAVDSVESATKSFETFAPQAPVDAGQFPGQGFLPHNRAWEMVSPPDKNGGDVIGNTARVQAAATESPGLPMAISFPSLSGFGDAIGSGVSFEYLAQRTGGSDTGWVTHATTPRQEPLSFAAASGFNLQPLYEGDMADDLTQGVFRAWSPLSPEPNVKDVENLYLRTDLRSPGKGNYRLLTHSNSLLPPLSPFFGVGERPFFDGASEDFKQVTFESTFNLTPDASGANQKLYKTDGSGALRLITAGSTACPGGASPNSPCSIAGRGASDQRRNPGAISEDGSRVFFSTPITTAFVSKAAPPSTKEGVTTKLFQLDDQGTAVETDDAVIQVNTSEKAVPDIAQAAIFQAGSSDGDRVFFSSGEQLTDTPVSGLYPGLYLWDRQDTDERQRVVVDATGGTFALTAHSQPTIGTGEVTSGSTSVTSTKGSFSVGQVVTGAGIQPGTVITAVGSFSEITLSKPATADGTEVALQASRQATTAAIPFDASPAQVQAALEALPLVGTGNVTVSGGPAAGYDITFVGALAGVNVAQLTAEASALTGGAASATVSTPDPVTNLSLISPGADGPGADGLVGISNDGHRAYFASRIATLGGPIPSGGFERLYYWQDATGSPSLAIVGDLSVENNNGIDANQFFGPNQVARVTPDGKTLLFASTSGAFLTPEYQHGICPRGPCNELYRYDADLSSPLAPHVECASCNSAASENPNETTVNQRFGLGGSSFTEHLNRAISEDGRFVFFTTAERLVSEDINGAEDAYVYDATAGVQRLLSSGKDPSPSFFMDIAADGADAFFITAEQLSGWDVDGNYDLYDARVDGGFPEPPPAPPSCLGDGCQPAPTVVDESVAASAIYSGPASKAASRKRCRKRFRRVNRGGKSRCVKRNRHRRTNKSGRAAR